MYKKANPRADIDARSRDQFWASQEASVCVCVYVFVCVCVCVMPLCWGAERGRAAKDSGEEGSY